MNEQTKQMIEAEAERFIDSQFGGLDLSGFPNLQKPANEESAASDKHGFSNVDFGQGNPLKSFIENPDGESLERLARETGDPELQMKLAEEKASSIAREFVVKAPQYVQTDANFEAIIDYMLRKHLGQSLRAYSDADEGSLALLAAGAWSVESITAAFRVLLRAGQLEVEAGVAKALSESERLHVISLCKSGQLEDAVSQYLSYSYPNAERDWADVTSFLSDPSTVEVRNLACRFAWYHSRPVEDSAEWRAFESKWFRHRPIRTVADYDHAYAEFRKQYKNEVRNKLLFGDEQANANTPATQEQSLDDLSDDQISQLKTATLREMARRIKRGQGVLV